jgi:hypothetical protein
LTLVLTTSLQMLRNLRDDFFMLFFHLTTLGQRRSTGKLARDEMGSFSRMKVLRGCINRNYKMSLHFKNYQKYGTNCERSKLILCAWWRVACNLKNNWFAVRILLLNLQTWQGWAVHIFEITLSGDRLVSLLFIGNMASHGKMTMRENLTFMTKEVIVIDCRYYPSICLDNLRKLI